MLKSWWLRHIVVSTTLTPIMAVLSLKEDRISLIEESAIAFNLPPLFRGFFLCYILSVSTRFHDQSLSTCWAWLQQSCYSRTHETKPYLLIVNESLRKSYYGNLRCWCRTLRFRRPILFVRTSWRNSRRHHLFFHWFVNGFWARSLDYFVRANNPRNAKSKCSRKTNYGS